jgi:hypothetical protein
VDILPSIGRRHFLIGAAAAAASTELELTGSLGAPPARADTSALTPSDIQFDIGAFTAAPTTADGFRAAFPPVHTLFVTARLLRHPGPTDQAELRRALATLEQAYRWGAAGLITFVAYGKPYFDRLDHAMVGAQVPRGADAADRSVLQEAVPAPTDVVAGNGIHRNRFNVPVSIERNDVLFTFRSDRLEHIVDAVAWLSGSGLLRRVVTRSPALRMLLRTTGARHMFVQRGLPRAVADRHHLPFARVVDPDSPIWMGLADQQVDAAGPPQLCTFQGNSTARSTTAAPGSYFDNGSIQHLSHDILDMFHALASGNADLFTDGGGPAFVPTQDRGRDDAGRTAQGIGADGRPVHIRMDGAGFDSLDVPGGSRQPKSQVTLFVPDSDVVAVLRADRAAPDLATQFGVDERRNGPERFITSTRRQNFLIPPRRVRAFPLIELGA